MQLCQAEAAACSLSIKNGSMYVACSFTFSYPILSSAHHPLVTFISHSFRYLVIIW